MSTGVEMLDRLSAVTLDPSTRHQPSKIAAQVKLIRITAAHAPYRIHFRNGMADTFDFGADSDERHAPPRVDPHCDGWQELGN
ncbi:hypothetical protein BO1005MUT1_440004 [Hyphomicrobiales bacterium]|nr:hypothetical protein BO1005MUT1_440004 [Hyphomicrobiales bacterium]